MAALTENHDGLVLYGVGGDGGTITDSLPVSDTDDQFFLNAILARNIFTDKIRPAGVSAEGGFGAYFAGISAQEKNDNSGGYGASSGREHPVIVFDGKQVGKDLAVAGAAAADDAGKPVYAPTDNPDDFTLTWSVDAVKVGYVHKYVSTNVADVRFMSADEAAKEFAVDELGLIWLKLAEIDLNADLGADADSVATVAGACTISTAKAVVRESTTDADAAVTLTPNIAGTITTGGAVVLSDTAGSAPASLISYMGATIPGTLTTAANSVTAGQAIGWDPDSVTAYTDGEVDFYVGITK